MVIILHLKSAIEVVESFGCTAEYDSGIGILYITPKNGVRSCGIKIKAGKSRQTATLYIPNLDQNGPTHGIWYHSPDGKRVKVRDDVIGVGKAR